MAEYNGQSKIKYGLTSKLEFNAHCDYASTAVIDSSAFDIDTDSVTADIVEGTTGTVSLDCQKRLLILCFSIYIIFSSTTNSHLRGTATSLVLIRPSCQLSVKMSTCKPHHLSPLITPSTLQAAQRQRDHHPSKSTA